MATQTSPHPLGHHDQHHRRRRSRHAGDPMTRRSVLIVFLFLATWNCEGRRSANALNSQIEFMTPVIQRVSSAPTAKESEYGRVLRPAVVELKEETDIPILLPNQLPRLAKEHVYADAEGARGRYSIRLESDPECDKANVCFLGLLDGRRGESYSYPDRLRLDNEAEARYKQRAAAPVPHRQSNGSKMECFTAFNWN
jgi:hypothetical protein